MCRNIKPLFNFDPPATEEEVQDASLQFVRKVSGFRSPSSVNKLAFDMAVTEVSATLSELLRNLHTTASPHNREVEQAKAKERSKKRFAS